MPLQIPVPGKIIAIGINYLEHAAEGAVEDTRSPDGLWPLDQRSDRTR